MERKARQNFWTGANWTPNHAASLYAFAENVIDIRGCLKNKKMRTVMTRTWLESNIPLFASC
jgi:hypothetical protein